MSYHSNRNDRKGPGYALAAEALFGDSKPLAKILLGKLEPILLDGLLYLGSSLGICD